MCARIFFTYVYCKIHNVRPLPTFYGLCCVFHPIWGRIHVFASAAPGYDGFVCAALYKHCIAESDCSARRLPGPAEAASRAARRALRAAQHR